MRKIELQEYQPTEETLSFKERDALKAAVPSVTIEPVAEDRYTLRPGSTVGALEIGDLSVGPDPAQAGSLARALPGVVCDGRVQAAG